MTDERDDQAWKWLYTPTDDEMRRSATTFDFAHTPETFDRWLSSVRADAIRVEAERVNDRPAGSDAGAWLRARADAIGVGTAAKEFDRILTERIAAEREAAYDSGREDHLAHDCCRAERGAP